MVNGWVWSPKENHKGNVQLGFGILTPTGKSNLQQLMLSICSAGQFEEYCIDYSIPARTQGGMGEFRSHWLSYTDVWRTQLYFNRVCTAMSSGYEHEVLAERDAGPQSVPGRCC